MAAPGCAKLTTGTPNDAFGVQALANNTTGANNVGVGYAAIQSNTTGNYNNFLGMCITIASLEGDEEFRCKLRRLVTLRVFPKHRSHCKRCMGEKIRGCSCTVMTQY